MPGVFVGAMMEEGSKFLEEIEGTFYIHDWKENQLWVSTAKEQSQTASENARKRWGNPSCLNSSSDTMSKHATGNAPSPIPIPNPNPTPIPLLQAGIDGTDDEVDELKKSDLLIVNLELCTGDLFPVHQSLIEKLKPLYPAVDVKEQFLQRTEWIIGNPSKRKTKKGIMRFITNWLYTQQDKASKSTMSASLARGASSKPRHYATGTGSLKTNPYDYNHL